MSPRKTGSEKTRFTLWLPDDLMDRLTQTQQAHAKESLAEVVGEGLMVYVDLIKAREEGAEPAVRAAHHRCAARVQCCIR